MAMRRLALSYGFDPTLICELPGPGWRFSFRFRVPGVFFRPQAGAVAEKLRKLPLSVGRIRPDEKRRHFHFDGKFFGFIIEVQREARELDDGLQQFEGDFWKLCSTMYALGFREASFTTMDQNKETKEN